MAFDRMSERRPQETGCSDVGLIIVRQLAHVLCGLLLMLTLFSGTAKAEGEHSFRNSGTALVYFENDLFGGTDQFYTNAVQATLISPDLINWAESGDLPDVLDHWVMSLPFAKDKGSLFNVSFSLGQQIYTPSDTQVTYLLEDDRPYAGFLYTSFGLHAKRENRLDTLELTLGLVGPPALGEAAQNEVHRVRHLKTAKGWDNQLETEPGAMVTWERKWRITPESPSSGWGWAVIPHTGVTVGNIMTYANAGGEVRYGWNLPADFGTSLIRPGAGVGAPVDENDPRVGKTPSYGAYVFAGTDVRAVARNIFLDGNTFKQSHSVDKLPVVYDLFGGVGFVLGRWRISYTHAYRSEEFYAQDRAQHFGSVQLAFSF